MTQLTSNSPTRLVRTLDPNLRNDSESPPPNIHQSLPVQISIWSVNTFPCLAAATIFNPSSGLPLAQIPLSVPSKTSQPRFDKFKPQNHLKTTQTIPFLNIHINPPYNSCSLSPSSFPTCLTLHLNKPIHVSSMQTSLTFCHECFPTMNYTIHQNTTIFCYYSTFYFLAVQFSSTIIPNHLFIHLHSKSYFVFHFRPNYKLSVAMAIDKTPFFFENYYSSYFLNVVSNLQFQHSIVSRTFVEWHLYLLPSTAPLHFGLTVFLNFIPKTGASFQQIF